MLLFSSDHGISTKRMECGRDFCAVCGCSDDDTKISDADVSDSMDFGVELRSIESIC